MVAYAQFKAGLGHRVRVCFRKPKKKGRVVGEKARNFLECRMQPSPSNILNFVFTLVYVWPIRTV